MKRTELSKVLEYEGIPSDWYSLYGDFLADRVVLFENYGKWEIFYVDERGGRNVLKICGSEESACDFIHQEMLVSLFAQYSIFFSRTPKLLSHTLEVIGKRNILEVAILGWIDSIIVQESTLPSKVNIIIFDLSKDAEINNVTIRFWGTNKVEMTNDGLLFTVDYVPFCDSLSVCPKKGGADFKNDFMSVIRNSVINGDIGLYENFFRGKSIYVGARGDYHIVS
jgi:hypothetical protein